MGHFENKEQLQKVFDEFWERAIRVEEVYDKLCKSEITAQFVIHNPDVVMTIDFKNVGPDGKRGSLRYEDELPPDIIVYSSSEIANKFWQGKIRTSVAMAKGEIRMRGSITRGLGLIWKIRPLYDIYTQVLEDLGFSDLIVSQKTK